MKAVLMAAAAAMLLTACKKNDNNTEDAQVNISLTTYYKDGSTETKRDRSGAYNSTSFGQVITEGGINKYFVDLGTAGTAHTQATFGVSFTFNQQNIPQGVNGTFQFPQDQAALRVTLRNSVTTTFSENLFLPTRGNVHFMYDTATKKISGTIQELEFNPLPNDRFNRYRVTLNGSFSAIPVR